MTAPQIRLRRHTDGRVAAWISSARSWIVINTSHGVWQSANDVLNGPGWSELFVAELPEPDGHIETDAAPYWNGPDDMPSFVVYHDGVETEAGEIVAAEELRADALKMLAAASASEQHRAERATT